MGCGNDQLNQHILGVIGEAKNSVVVVGEDPIDVDRIDLGNQVQYRVSYKPYTEPQINLTVTPAKAEVGQNISSVFFEGGIIQGREIIASKTIAPQSITDAEIDDNFSFQVADVTRATEGIAASHTVTVNDGEGVYSRTTGVEFVTPYYYGVSTQSPLTAPTVTTTMTKTLNSHKGTRDYVISQNGQYIYWLQEVTKPDLVSGELNALPFPIQKEGYQLTITNDFGVPVTHSVFRSVNKFNVSSLNGITIE